VRLYILMIGIGLCRKINNVCPKREECLRFTQETNNDAFISFMNILDNGECKWFWSNNDTAISEGGNNHD